MSEIQKFYEDDCNESERLSSQAGQIEYITTMDYMRNGHIDDSNLFYSATPEMVERDMEKFGLQLLHNIAVDGPIFLYREIVDQMNKKDFEAFMSIHKDICDKKSNLGYSEHGLIIARKQAE